MSPPGQQPAYTSAPRTRSRFGKGRLVVAAVAAVAVVGGVTALAVTTGGGEGELVDTNGVASPLMQSVGNPPEEVWEWEPPDDGAPQSVVDLDDKTVVSWYAEDGSGLTALDDQGEEIWSTDVDFPGPLIGDIPGEDIVLSAGEEGGGTTAFSAENGEEVWSTDDGYVAGITGDGLLWSDFEGDVSLLDPQTGDEIWSNSADDFSVAGDAVYLVTEGELTKVDLASGEETWTTDNDTEAGDGSLSVAAGSEVVVVIDEDEVIAFSASDGDELWSDSLSGSASTAGPFVDDLFWVYMYGDTESLESEVVFYDSEGEVESMSVDDADYFFASVVKAGGEEYLLDAGSGTLFDTDLTELEDYDGEVSPVDDGVYTYDSGDLSFTRFGDEDEEWSLDLGSEQTRFRAGNASVFGLTDYRVTRYE